ncbi:hypothetical protein F5H01DRAFT_344368 [Linnemannia elongata]|nr:hypothetical protein F5H01DRAFT_344368 [Linnemannia elongata]
MAPTPTTKMAARKARLTSIFLLCLTLSSVSAAPMSTPREKRAQNVLFYEDRKAYSYCEADHPTIDTYPDPPVWILFCRSFLSFVDLRNRVRKGKKQFN